MTREEKLIEKYEVMSAFEKECIEEGTPIACGIDEAGRGPLAGPVVAAACILDPEKPIYGLDDSKKLSPKKRDQLYDEIMAKAKCFCVIRVEPKEIDEVNILNATKNAMRACVKGLAIKPDVLLIDAVNLEGTGIPVKPIIKGDAKSNSIAAASILAKVSRDRIMEEYDKEYPGYGFAQHKGYGTAAHYAAIHELGISPIHRMSFLKKMH
ncbi:MAG: ribonuclease HII [Clostridiales bacterium]|nr:ribonuclease HII [Clostridiales bacterium]MBR5417381.1 ribonuclease HII [Clostridiales bacterium]